jgi:hypothetical protein
MVMSMAGGAYASDNIGKYTTESCWMTENGIGCIIKTKIIVEGRLAYYNSTYWHPKGRADRYIIPWDGFGHYYSELEAREATQPMNYKYSQTHNNKVARAHDKRFKKLQQNADDGVLR